MKNRTTVQFVAILRDVAQLLRLPVSLMVACAAAYGWLLVRPRPESGPALLMLGAALLAAACSACNQVQEKDSDALLPRTKNRPLPSGRMRDAAALVISAAAFAAACLCLRAVGGLALACWAPAIALVYNGLYTPLKRKSGLALLPGALAGATPPLLGWTGAGGELFDPLALGLYGLYVLWQIPHFLLRVDKDRTAYAAAGLPLPDLFLSGPFGGRPSRAVLRPEVADGALAAAMLLILADRMIFL